MTMKTPVKYLVTGMLIVLLNGLTVSCDIRKSDSDPGDAYTKIFDYGDMNLSFYPVDLKQTDDGGFLVLSVYTDTTLSTFPLIHLMKTDKLGNRIWENWVDKSYCSAVPSILEVAGNYYFICMDAVNQQTRVMQVDLQGRTVNQSGEFTTQYPLYCMQDGNGDVMVLNFDRQARKSILTKYGSGFEEIWSSVFPIVGDVKHEIELHLSKTGHQFPFFIGEAGTPSVTHYYVNCFYNYTMTMLFVGAAAGDQTGTLYTYQDNAGVSSAVSIENNRFALTRYYSGANFVNPSVELNLTATQSVTDYPDLSLQELSPDAPVKCLHAEINGRNVIVFGSQTRTNQLAIYFYDAADGSLKHVKFLNEKYPITLSDMEYTQEKGLALLLQTFVIGRFPRIDLMKLSPKDLKY
jgi:hypothetical protein